MWPTTVGVGVLACRGGRGVVAGARESRERKRGREVEKTSAGWCWRVGGRVGFGQCAPRDGRTNGMVDWSDGLGLEFRVLIRDELSFGTDDGVKSTRFGLYHRSP
jgi:hypothetical protein